MSSKFNSTIDKIVIKANENMLGVVKNAIRNVVIEAQTPVAKGGKMRVDTGFLRWSGTASLDGMPYGEVRGRKRLPGEEGVLVEYNYDENNGGRVLNDVLIRLKFGDTFHFGWTANYAKYRETYDGFLVSAIANFQTYVDKETRRLKK